jgi:hypothetical protein
MRSEFSANDVQAGWPMRVTQILRARRLGRLADIVSLPNSLDAVVYTSLEFFDPTPVSTNWWALFRFVHGVLGLTRSGQAEVRQRETEGPKESVRNSLSN